MTLKILYQTILNRQQQASDRSYVASLFQQGTDRIIQKVGEEAVEVVIAAKNNDADRLISETADLFFHTLVMLAACQITLDQVLIELEQRNSPVKAKGDATIT